jgi:cyclophilin family peptidyl-prolyl cis-trans isomerase
MKTNILFIFIIISALVLSGCAQEETANTTTKEGVTMIQMETTKGTIKVELYDNEAPITTSNFKELVQSNFYDGLTFHRYEPDFVIQGGDPKGDGTGGSDKTIPLEISDNLKHDAGVIAMARSQEPNSASSQFYFTLAPAHFLDGNYAVFGKVVEGMDVVLELRADDKIIKVEEVN